MKTSFSELSYKELLSKKEELSKKYMDLRFSKVTGHLESPIELRKVRRNIATVNTLIHAYQIGLKK